MHRAVNATESHCSHKVHLMYNETVIYCSVKHCDFTLKKNPSKSIMSLSFTESIDKISFQTAVHTQAGFLLNKITCSPFQVKKDSITMEPNGSVPSHQDRPIPRLSLGSSSGLHYGSFVNSLSSLTPKPVDKPAISRRRAYIAVAVLCYINLINYMERYTIAG